MEAPSSCYGAQKPTLIYEVLLEKPCRASPSLATIQTRRSGSIHRPDANAVAFACLARFASRSRSRRICNGRFQRALTNARTRSPGFSLRSSALKFEICSMEGKGLGAVATESIAVGAQIFTESPIVVLSLTNLASVFSQQLEFVDQCTADIRDLLSRCTEEEQGRFWNLASTQDGGNRSVLGISLTNTLLLKSGKGGIFLTTSRFNHSCNPNAHNVWSEENGVMELHAARNIEAGEEVCISYMELYASRQQRQTESINRFNFSCSCVVCNLAGAARTSSDEKRRLLKDFDDALLAGCVSEVHGATGVADVVDRMIRLLDDEFSGSPARKRRVFCDGFMLAVRSGNRSLAVDFLEKACAQSLLADGASSETLRLEALRDVLVSPSLGGVGQFLRHWLPGLLRSGWGGTLRAAATWTTALGW